MLKNVLIPAYKYEFEEIFEQFKDGGTIREFINRVESMARNLPEGHDVNKFKGDMLEVFAEIFFYIFHSDECVGLTNYTPIDIRDDYGVDAIGLNPNGHKAAVQVKYRANPKDIILYSDIGKTFTSGVLQHGLDLAQDYTVYLFTTSNGVTPACKNVLGKRLVIITREIISQKVDNNKNFWALAFEKVYEYLDNI